MDERSKAKTVSPPQTHLFEILHVAERADAKLAEAMTQQSKFVSPKSATGDNIQPQRQYFAYTRASLNSMRLASVKKSSSVSVPCCRATSDGGALADGTSSTELETG